MKYAIFTIIVVGLILNFACTDSSMDSTQTFDTSKGIVPLAVGNTWVRFGTNYSKSRSDTTTGYDTTKILRDTLINGMRWYILFTNGERIVANLSGGLYFYFAESGSSIWLKYPGSVNDTFMVQGNASFRVSNIDTNITVPAGTFDCYRYDFDLKPSTDYIGGSKIVYYVSPNNGFIKYETYFSSDTSASLNLSSKIEITKIILK